MNKLSDQFPPGYIVIPAAQYDGVVDEMCSYFEIASWQARTGLESDYRLMVVAQARAYDMAANDYFRHKDQGGVWPNEHVIAAGYRLSAWYRLKANFVESIASGFGSPVSALDALAESPPHHDHVAGLGFWADHLRYGMGFAWVDDRRIYVVITAPIEAEIEPGDAKYWAYLPYIGKGVRDAADPT